MLNSCYILVFYLLIHLKDCRLLAKTVVITFAKDYFGQQCLS